MTSEEAYAAKVRQWVMAYFEGEERNICLDAPCVARKIKRHRRDERHNQWQSVLLYGYLGFLQRMPSLEPNVVFGRLLLKCLRSRDALPFGTHSTGNVPNDPRIQKTATGCTRCRHTTLPSPSTSVPQPNPSPKEEPPQQQQH